MPNSCSTYRTRSRRREVHKRMLPAIFYALLAAWCLNEPAVAQESAVDIQEDWKRPNYEGQVEYRCWVFIPDRWEGRELSIFLEAADDARECRWEDARIAQLGSFPPNYRSGLGETNRFSIPAANIRFGDWNQVTMRIYRRASRDNFNVAPPTIFAGEQGIRLDRSWLKAIDQFDGEVDSDPRPDVCLHDKIESAAELETKLQLIGSESGALSPLESLATLQMAEGLTCDAVLAEPAIGQPLSLKFDSRGRMWLVEYLQYPDPAGLEMISRDKFLRTVYDKVPPPPPEHFVGADRISIHEDRDGDGIYEHHKNFVDGLNMVSSFAIGRGGLFVLNPPYLLFYPDANQDDVPDGPPEVLLEGFGLEDSHSIANSLRWGPDGWLYAAQGSTVTAHIRPYKSEAPPIHSMGQLIWRYHPATMQYEVFAEGGGNAFGLEIDSVGRIYSGHNGGDTRGFHYVQGGYFQKSFGKHGSLSNPYTFGYFPWMKHHAVPRFSHTFVIEEGGLFSQPFAGRLFGVEPLQGRVVMSEISADGSTFATRDVGYAMQSGDLWVRPVDIQSGPNGALFVADFYEQRIDHSSHYQGRVDRESGRIYRIAPADIDAEHQSTHLRQDLATASLEALANALTNPNRWIRETALRVIGDRQLGDAEFWFERLEVDTTDRAVNYLWAANLVTNLETSHWVTALQHPNPHVRRWAVRLSCDDGTIAGQMVDQLDWLAANEVNTEVLSQLASSARRLTAMAQLEPRSDRSAGLRLASTLASRSQLASDPHLPLLIWWVFEAHAEVDQDGVLACVADSSWRQSPLVRDTLLSRIMRRYAATEQWTDLETSARLFQVVDDEASITALLSGFDQAFAGRPLPQLPNELIQQLRVHRGDSLEWAVRLGELGRLPQLLTRLQSSQESQTKKLEWIELLENVNDPRVEQALWEVAEQQSEVSLRLAALSALSRYTSAEIPSRALSLYRDGGSELQTGIETLLAGRATWAMILLDEVSSGRIAASDLSQSTLDLLSLHFDKQVVDRFEEIWGVESEEVDTTESRVDGFIQLLEGAGGNPYQGRELFAEHCGRCHTLFNKGGNIGPDLTAYHRADVRRLMANLISPSREIREGFETEVVLTWDGRTVSGFIADEDPRQLAIQQADGQIVRIPKDEIELRRRAAKSIMPDNLLDQLNEDEIRDLFAYLCASQPLPD